MTAHTETLGMTVEKGKCKCIPYLVEYNGHIEKGNFLSVVVDKYHNKVNIVLTFFLRKKIWPGCVGIMWNSEISPNLGKCYTVKHVWTQPPWAQLCVQNRQGLVQFMQVKLTKMFYIMTFFLVQFIQDFNLFRVQFRHVLLFYTRIQKSWSIVIHANTKSFHTTIAVSICKQKYNR